MSKSKSKITALRLVYPPISNAQAVGLQKDKEVERLLRQSDFYMIGGRAHARLLHPCLDHSTNSLSFDFVVGDGAPNSVLFKIQELPGVRGLNGADFNLEIDDAGSGFRIWLGPIGQPSSEVVEWYTPDSLLWHKTRGRAGIYGLPDVHKLATFDLLYVGIAKQGDSFSRLLLRGHKARQEILANEPQRYPGARVSDETFLFMFAADPLVIQTFEVDHEFTDADFDAPNDNKMIVADAEKAFVSLLKPAYNVQLFKNYPRGTDGLYGSEYERYGYVIAERMAFNTPHGTFRGGVDENGMINNDSDAIFVDGDNVSLYRSGVDF
mgnify:CR=1 FL=1|tara:strand:- start:800 stop:1768 length:969 start_codon:yes stop_codon:yes gene_type:complete